MSGISIFTYLITWSLVGAVLFSLFVIFVFRSGIVYSARQEDGMLKDKIPWRGYLSMVLFLIFFLTFMAVANYYGIVRTGTRPGLGALYLLNLAHYLVLFTFDTVVIDYFVIGHWRPNFLKLPAAMGGESMRAHIQQSLPVGSIFGLILALLVTWITYYWVM